MIKREQPNIKEMDLYNGVNANLANDLITQLLKRIYNLEQKLKVREEEISKLKN